MLCPFESENHVHMAVAKAWQGSVAAWQACGRGVASRGKRCERLVLELAFMTVAKSVAAWQRGVAKGSLLRDPLPRCHGLPQATALRTVWAEVLTSERECCI